MINFKNLDKIKFEKIGNYYYPKKAFGKIINNFVCPICRKELIVYKRKGLFKIKCSSCSWENIRKEIIRITDNELYNSISSFFKKD